MQVPTADRELSPVAGHAHSGIAARPQVDTRRCGGIGLCAATDVRPEPAVQLEARPRAPPQILRAGKNDARGLVGNAWLVEGVNPRTAGIAPPPLPTYHTLLQPTHHT